MPTEAAIFCSIVVVAFAILALTLAWAQHRTASLK